MDQPTSPKPDPNGAPTELPATAWQNQLQNHLLHYAQLRFAQRWLWLTPLLAGCCYAWLLLASWLAVSKPHWLIVLRLLTAGLPLACLAYYTWQARRLQGSLSPSQQRSLAQQLEHQLPSLGSSLTTAIDLDHSQPSPALGSPQLIAAHGQHVVKNWPLEQIQAHHQRQQDYIKIRMRWLGAISASVCLLLTLRSSQPIARLIGLGGTSISQPWLLPTKACIQDLQLQLIPPAYTGKPNQQLMGSDGMLKAMAHTQVNLQAHLCEPAQAVLLVTQPEYTINSDPNAASSPSEPNQASEPAPTLLQWPMTILSGTDKPTFSHRWELLHTGPYWFTWQDQDGIWWRDKLDRRMDALPDQAPTVRLEEPATDQEVQPDGLLQLSIHAEDDVGLQRIELIIRNGQGGEPPKIQQTISGEQIGTSYHDSIPLRLAQLQLASEEDEVLLSIRATDNDTLQGPKSSETPPIRLTLLSPERSQQKALELAEELLREAVAWLAKELVTPWPTSQLAAAERQAQTTIQEGILTFAGHVQTLVETLTQDPLANVDLRQMLLGVKKWSDVALNKRTALLAGTYQRWPERIPRLENIIIALDDTLGLMRIHGLQDTTKRLLHAKQALQSLLQQRAKTTDPAELKAIDQQIAQQQARMQQLLAQLQQSKRQLPGEFRNVEALSNRSMQENLQSLQENLDKGDMDSAANSLEDLANMLENINQSLQEAEQNYGGERYQELQKGVTEVTKEIASLTKAEQQLAERLSKTNQQRQADNLAEQGTDLATEQRSMQALLQLAQQQLDQIARIPTLPLRLVGNLEQLRHMLLDVSDAIAIQDMAGALAQADSIDMQSSLLYSQLQANKETAGPSAKAHQAIGQAMAALRNLMEQGTKPPTAKQQAQDQQMAQEQQALLKRSEALAEKMNELSQEVPLFDGAPMQQIQDAAGQMQQAAQALREQQNGPAQRAAVGAAQSLQQLQERLNQQQQQQQGGKGGKGMPRPGGFQPQGRSEQQRGGENADRSKQDVLIPKQANNQQRDKFRQELMEAAKQQAPQNYKEAVRRYYEELVR